MQDAIPSKGRSLWRGVFLADISNPASPKITLAERGALLSESAEKVRFHLEDGTQQELIPKAADQYSITTFESTDIPIELPSSADRGPRDLLPVPELSLHGLLRNAKRERIAGASLVKIDPASSSYDYLKARYYEIEFHRRFALPAACLVLALVGIPLGLSARKGGSSAGFVLTIVLVFIYYFFSLVGVSLARQGKVAPWVGVWAGNFFFFLCGLFLLWRVDRMPLDFSVLNRLTSGLRERLSTAWWSLTWISRWPVAPRRCPPTPKAIRREISANPRRYDPARLRHVLGDDPGDLPDPRAGLHLLRVADRYCPQQGVIHRARRVPAEPEPIADLPHGAHVGPARRADYLRPDAEVQRTDRYEGHGHQHLSRNSCPSSSCRPFLLPDFLSSTRPTFPTPTSGRRSYATRSRANRLKPTCRPNANGFLARATRFTTTRCSIPDADRFGGISVFEFDPATFQLTRRIHADGAHWEPRLKKWVFENGWVRSLSGASIQEYRTFDVATFNELGEDPSYFKKEVRQSSEMDYETLRNYIQDLQQSGFDTVRLKVQLQKKFAFPLITLVMAVLAIPFSAQGRRGGALAGVAIALGIAIVYWVTAGLFEAMGNANQLPALLAAWAPDFIFALAGGYMLLRVPT